jgi:hypothetical protein
MGTITAKSERILPLVLGFPIVLLCIAGLLSLVIKNIFTPIAILILLGVLVLLLFHERLFVGNQPPSDPIPDGALRSFATVGLFFTALGVAFFALRPLEFAAPTRSAYPVAEWMAVSQAVAVATVPGQVGDALLLVGLILVIVTPVAALLFWGLAQRKRTLGKASILVSFGLLVAVLIFLLRRDTPDWLGVGGLLVRVNTLICIYAVIFFFTGFLTLAFFLIWMNAPQSQLESLLADKGIAAFAIPMGVSLGDVVTMAQGFSGLREHYAFMGVVATIGAFIAVLSILAVLAFSVAIMFHGFKRGGLSHYLFSTSCALLIGAIILAALAETGGLLYSVTAGAVAPAPAA